MCVSILARLDHKWIQLEPCASLFISSPKTEPGDTGPTHKTNLVYTESTLTWNWSCLAFGFHGHPKSGFQMKVQNHRCSDIRAFFACLQHLPSTLRSFFRLAASQVRRCAAATGLCSKRSPQGMPCCLVGVGRVSESLAWEKAGSASPCRIPTAMDLNGL